MKQSLSIPNDCLFPFFTRAEINLYTKKDTAVRTPRAGGRYKCAARSIRPQTRRGAAGGGGPSVDRWSFLLWKVRESAREESVEKGGKSGNQRQQPIRGRHDSITERVFFSPSSECRQTNGKKTRSEGGGRGVVRAKRSASELFDNNRRGY